MRVTIGPSDAQQRWMDLKYGLFVHYGPNTFLGKAWSDGTTDAKMFAPHYLDCDQWAGVAAEAGMRYAVLTAKHHDGFCLWPTETTDYCVRSAAVTTDVVGAFCDACRRAGLQPGLYYSLWDRHEPCYADDAAYAEFMQRQIRELGERYGPLCEWWFDGGWDKEHPTRQWQWNPAWADDPDPAVQSELRGDRWRWRELYELLHELQPDCMVGNNACSDRAGQVKYHPVDFRTAERMAFVSHGREYPRVIESVHRRPDGTDVYLPMQYEDLLCPDWFYIHDRFYPHPTEETIVGWRQRAAADEANLLLNVGPTPDGVIPEYHARHLIEAQRRLGDNDR